MVRLRDQTRKDDDHDGTDSCCDDLREESVADPEIDAQRPEQIAADERADDSRNQVSDQPIAADHKRGEKAGDDSDNGEDNQITRLAVHLGSEGILNSETRRLPRLMSGWHSALNVAASAKILIEQVVVLVNVAALGGRKLATVAGSLDLSRDTLEIETVELATN